MGVNGIGEQTEQINMIRNVSIVNGWRIYWPVTTLHSKTQKEDNQVAFTRRRKLLKTIQIKCILINA